MIKSSRTTKERMEQLRKIRDSIHTELVMLRKEIAERRQKDTKNKIRILANRIRAQDATQA